MRAGEVLPGDFVYVQPYRFIGLVVTLEGEELLVTDETGCAPLKVNVNDVPARYRPFIGSEA